MTAKFFPADMTNQVVHASGIYETEIPSVSSTLMSFL